MTSPPFKMFTETKMEKWRYDTFWTKEPETIAWIRSFDNNSVLYDIGANIGVYSLYHASLSPNRKAVAFEPSKKNYFRLLDNIRLNGFKNIHPNRYIICDKTGNMDFVETSEEVGSSGGQAMDSWEVGDVGCFSLDDFIIHGFYSPNVDHIKIDIDGQELKVIQGMKETLKSQKLKSVLVEIDYSPTNIRNAIDILGIFLDYGFTADNEFNGYQTHSRERRIKEGILVENIIFTRRS